MVSKQERSLTWKYFLQQKIGELMIISCVLFLCYLVARIMRWVDVITINRYGGKLVCEELAGVCWAGYFFIGVLLLVISCFFLFMVGWIIAVFIKSNWKKAKKRAKEDIRNIKKGRKRK